VRIRNFGSVVIVRPKLRTREQFIRCRSTTKDNIDLSLCFLGTYLNGVAGLSYAND
jgi:hypothetical protein